MCSFEVLMLLIMILGIVVEIVLDYINRKKK